MTALVRAPFRDACKGYSAIIGLCGGIASGKSHAREYLASLGALVIDADRLGHEVYKVGNPAHDRIVEEFSPSVLDAHGEVDRKLLGAAVFGKPSALSKLNGIVWPEVERLAVSRFQSMYEEYVAAHPPSGAPPVAPIIGVIEAALLIEAGWADALDEVWVTYIPEAEATARLMERNGLSAEAAKLRIASQMSNEERLKHADVIIDTSGSKEDTKRALHTEWEKLLARTRARVAMMHGA